MFQTFYGIIFSLLTAIVVIAADLLIKIAAESGERVLSTYMAAGSALYVLSAVMWFFAMRHMPLGHAAVAYSMFTLIGLFVIGITHFDEPLQWREGVGIGLALMAMAIMLT
ncbi:hypothetical protein ACRARG_14565 [Pseudooceanicola sp. C21-150M6]|uniref:hypothetical protein n=1 Tax=Pseudooceanicola sp. C21-150M6 TaxID=3434355 RepID=UPI003D7FC053